MPDLPVRRGPRPRTTNQIPHHQIDQQPADGSRSAGVFEDALAALDGVREAPSQVSVPGARSLVVDDRVARGPAEAFIIGREFAHIHPGPDHSLHLALPCDLARHAQAQGWAEPHFLVRAGELPPSVVMVYAPRDSEECEVVATLIRASYRYATAPEKTPARAGPLPQS